MPEFSQESQKKLMTCHPFLVILMKTVVNIMDIKVLEGARDLDHQKELVAEGLSKTLDSKHLKRPSMAVDVAPYPVDWKNLKRFYFLAGVVKAVSFFLGFNVRWGGDWDQDDDFSDQNFNDLCHFELVDNGVKGHGLWGGLIEALKDQWTK